MAKSDFLPKRGNYRDLLIYQKAECIYDITYYFAHHYLEKGDRTIDQMVQAARSGKQNIVEGSAASTMSRETELKLTQVAKASLQELLVDYEDYLRVRGLEQWELDSEKMQQTRTFCRAHSDSAVYRAAMPNRSAETIANIALVLIHQTDVLIDNYIEDLKQDFLKNGGVREEMSRARRAVREEK
ncbi:MAG: four helix bundle suffix domain-containing protein [Alistipes sp.]|nr:four helix bundle suffix domain-containing protein [Alistipes sp.]